MKLPNNIIAGLTSITVALDVWTDPALTRQPLRLQPRQPRSREAPASGSGYLFTTTTPYRTTISNQWWNNEQNTSKGSNLQKGVWRHLTYTLTGGTGILYEDGVEVARNPGVTNTPAQIGGGTTTRNYIGRSAYAADNSFRGSCATSASTTARLHGHRGEPLATTVHQATVDSDATWVETALGDTSAVITNLTLPSTGPAKSTITWSSSNTAVIANNGTVTRPERHRGQPDSDDHGRYYDNDARHRRDSAPGRQPDQDAVDVAAATPRRQQHRRRAR